MNHHIIYSNHEQWNLGATGTTRCISQDACHVLKELQRRAPLRDRGQAADHGAVADNILGPLTPLRLGYG